MSNVESITASCVCGKRRVITDPNAMQSFNKIAFCTKFEPGYLKQIKSVVKEVSDAIQNSENELQEHYKRLAKKGADGKPVITPRKDNPNILSYEFETAEDKAAADKIYKEMGELEIKLSHRQKLYLSKLLPAELSAADLINLEFMIDEER